jgi:hypothetical protein
MLKSLSPDHDELPIPRPSIPNDTLPIIFSYIEMTPKTLFYLSKVNKAMCEEANQHQHWESAFFKKYPFSSYLKAEGPKASLKRIFTEAKRNEQIERVRIWIVSYLLAQY